MGVGKVIVGCQESLEITKFGHSVNSQDVVHVVFVLFLGNLVIMSLRGGRTNIGFPLVVSHDDDRELFFATNMYSKIEVREDTLIIKALQWETFSNYFCADLQ